MRSGHLATAALAAGALLGTTGLAGARSTAARKPVAFWHVDARVGCAQPKTCQLLPPWMSQLRNPMDVAAFADGTMYFRAEVYATGRQGPRRCDRTLFDKPFTGTCHVADYGVGFIRKTSIPGPYKGLDFWVESETALIGSDPRLQVNPFGPYPIDTANPAWPGHHTIDQFAKAKAGETLTVDVTRTPVR